MARRLRAGSALRTRKLEKDGRHQGEKGEIHDGPDDPQVRVGNIERICHLEAYPLVDDDHFVEREESHCRGQGQQLHPPGRFDNGEKQGEESRRERRDRRGPREPTFAVHVERSDAPV